MNVSTIQQSNSNGNAKTNHTASFAPMAKLFIIACMAVLLMSACTRIESGQVGVQRDFSGE